MKDVGVDMLLPCIMAMDKTHIDMAACLQMEPITLLHGLLKHKEKVVTMAYGMKVVTVKTAEQVAADTAAQHDAALEATTTAGEATGSKKRKK